MHQKSFLKQVLFSSTKANTVNPYSSILQHYEVNGEKLSSYNLKKIDEDKIEAMPYTIRTLLQNTIRNYDEEKESQLDIDNLLEWKKMKGAKIVTKPNTLLVNVHEQLQLEIALQDNSKKIQLLNNQPISTSGEELDELRKIPRNLRYILQNEEKIAYPNLIAGPRKMITSINSSGIYCMDCNVNQSRKLLSDGLILKNINNIIGFRISGTIPSDFSSDLVVNSIIAKLGQYQITDSIVQFYGPGAEMLTSFEKMRISELSQKVYNLIGYFPVDQQKLSRDLLDRNQKIKIQSILKNIGVFKDNNEDFIRYQKIIEMDLSLFDTSSVTFSKQQSLKNHQIQSEAINCKKVGKQMENYVLDFIKKIKANPKVSIVLSYDSQGKPNPASQIYVNKKMQLLPRVGINAELIKVTPDMKQSEMQDLLEKLNQNQQNTSTMVQLPFNMEFDYNINEVLGKVNQSKNIDGFNYLTPTKPNLEHPEALKPPTALGIAALIRYYGIETEGKNVIIVGKGPLVGAPLSSIMKSHPFYATVTNCDIFTENLSSKLKDADIIVAACGSAQFIKASDIKNGVVLIDAGINEVIQESKGEKRKITGDIAKQCYDKASLYTKVPGGVGIMTVSAMAFNVLNSYLLQKNMQTLSLETEFHNKHKLNKYLQRIQNKTKSLKVMLISSAYNGLTQKVDKSLNLRGYSVCFQAATSDEAMRQAVNDFKPDIIVCPTLMKAIPEDIYSRIKCLIVHPGIKGDRGPSSIDWAILKQQKQWGVTLLEADKQMDAGDIWGTQNFSISPDQSKVEIYNSLVSQTAENLIIKALQQFENKTIKPQKLDYSDPKVLGNLHRTIKLSDPERSINWETQNTSEIIRKSKAAETQPGLKVNIRLRGQKLTRFTYGYVAEKKLVAPEGVIPGQIFMRRHEAVCVKTIDGAVWIQQMRRPKNKQNPHPFKTPSTIHLGQSIQGLTQSVPEVLENPCADTFQEITFEKQGQIGILGFSFYNGAMSTPQCRRMSAAVREISNRPDIKFLVLKGSQNSWSNGIHLNVIENAESPQNEAWENIKAINEIVKAIYSMKDKLTIAAIQANAGAGGVYLGLACDYCFVKEGSVLNPHYKNMGLYGSELHTPTAIRKFGLPILRFLKESAQPILVQQAEELGLIEKLPTGSKAGFLDKIMEFVNSLGPDFNTILIKRNQKLKMLFKYKSIEEFEEEELNEMQQDMFKNRHQFKEKREAFVKKLP